MYYTYVLVSDKDNKFYIGWTEDIDRRIKEHNSGQVEVTKGRQPFLLVYYEACLDRDLAIKREKYLKTGYGRTFLKNRIGARSSVGYLPASDCATGAGRRGAVE